MATKEERNLKDELGPSPWPLYADRDEPWKDHELMLKLDDKFQYQYEIAHVLGCDESKISYWMQKAQENWSPDLSESDYECEYFEVCGYNAPHPGGACPTCLDVARENSARKHERGETYIDPNDSDDLADHMETLYEASEKYEVNSP